MILKCYEIKEIPDLTLNKYQSLASTGVSGVLERHQSFLRQWHGIGLESSSSFHLIYCFDPDDQKGNRLHIYFVIQCFEDVADDLELLLLQSPLTDFYTFSPCDMPDYYFYSGATLVKKERCPSLTDGKKVHYVPHWKVNNHARLFDLFKILETVSDYTPSAYRIDLYPNKNVDVIRDELTPVIQALQGAYDIELIKNSPTNRDSYKQAIVREHEDWLKQVESNPSFRVNIYGFSKNDFAAKMILNATASEAIEEGDFSLAPIINDDNGLCSITSRLNPTSSDYCFFPDEANLPSWATTYTLQEVAPFFCLPALYDGETIDIKKETDPQFFEEGIEFGNNLQGYPVMFPIEDLSRHALFTGTPGSGKTNTMLHLVTQLHQKDIPFLVMEPAKKEYRALLTHTDFEDVYLFSPHLQSHFPLRINPFEFPKGVRLSEHINALLDVFQGSFILEGPTYKFLSSAIQKAYTNLGWDIEDVNEDEEALYPSLQDVFNNIENEIKTSSYDHEIKGNVTAFLQVRLGSLMERDAGELFNTSISTLQPKQWIEKSAIVELEVLSEQAKNFFVLLVCHYILETLRVSPQTDLPIRHAIFIEEAHNIIAPQSQQVGDSVNPKISATQYIVKMLAEVRALKEAIIIADQLPTALATEVTKNTGLKLVHRLTAQDDREQIGSAISASPIQLEQLTTFSKGKALIFHEKTMRPFALQIHEWKKPEVEYDYSNDRQLYQNINQQDSIYNAIDTALVDFNHRYITPAILELSKINEDYKKLSDEVDLMLANNAKKILLSNCKIIYKKFNRLCNLWLIDESHQNASAIKMILDSIIQSLEKN